MQYAKIISTGSYLPEKILKNSDLEKMVVTSDEWITTRTGIKERRIANDIETSSAMGYHASLDAISLAGFDKSDIDLIIVATSTPDMLMPSTACLIQAKLGLSNIPAFDIQAACSGFLYAFLTAETFIKSCQAKTALVIGVDCLSKIIDYNDRNTCILFGDGAAAVVLQASSDPGIVASKIYANGGGAESLCVNSKIADGKILGNPYMHMDGKAIYKMAVTNLISASHDVLKKAQLTINDVDWLIPHQANLRIMESIANQLGISMEKVIVTIDRYGNTSAASIPLALHDATLDGRIKRGDLILLEGVGAGYTWGASLVRY